MRIESRFTALALVLAGCALAGPAAAQTCTTGVRQGSLTTLLTGRTVCATRAATGDRWQEYHVANGDVIDYKRGPTDPIDPTEKVGTWSVVTSGQLSTITYNYGTGGTYTYTVYRQTNGTYNFCSSTGVAIANVTGATLLTGQVPCP